MGDLERRGSDTCRTPGLVRNKMSHRAMTTVVEFIRKDLRTQSWITITRDNGVDRVRVDALLARIPCQQCMAYPPPQLSLPLSTKSALFRLRGYMHTTMPSSRLRAPLRKPPDPEARDEA